MARAGLDRGRVGSEALYYCTTLLHLRGAGDQGPVLIHNPRCFSLHDNHSAFLSFRIGAVWGVFWVPFPFQRRPRYPQAQPRAVQRVIQDAQAVGHGRTLAEVSASLEKGPQVGGGMLPRRL